MTGCEAVLIQPPFLRLAGSHNDKVPLELCYLATHLRQAGISCTVLNADATGANCYVSWRRLFENSHYLQEAANGSSPFYDETLERVLSYKPAVAVIAAGDGLTPWVDLGNAYVSAFLSRMLMRHGIYTIGVGPFYSRVPTRFARSFDAILIGAASPSVVDLVQQRPRNAIVNGVPFQGSTVPDTAVEPTGGRTDVVMTSFGCPMSCRFCFARDQAFVPFPLEIVDADIKSRANHEIELGDAILPLGMQRLERLATILERHGKKASCEVSVRSVTPRSVALLRRMGVVAVKMGVESGDDAYLRTIDKRQDESQVLRAASLIREAGIHLSAYVLLGGPEYQLHMAEKTLELCQLIRADDYVINVWAYDDIERRDFRQDGHFSQATVERWGLSGVMDDFFALQSLTKKGLGILVDTSSTAIDESVIVTDSWADSQAEQPGE